LQKYKAGRFNMADKSVTVEYKGRIAVITIDNQKKLNAMTQDQYYVIAKFLREVATHDEVFVTVLTGKGRFFSA
jgi:peroxisomal 3,2-trans-enoyl-CoA isomerase